MKAYAGFNPNMTTCGGFYQYKEGATYSRDNSTETPLYAGIYAYRAPLDIFYSCNPTNGSGDLNRFYELKLDGVLQGCHYGNTREIAKKITIRKELDLFELVRAHSKWLEEQNDTIKNHTTVNGSLSMGAGNASVATCTGDCCATTNFGNHSSVTNTGNSSVATNTGDYSISTVTGDHSAALSAGYHCASASVGCWSAAVSTGSYSVAANAGSSSTAAATGKDSIAVSWGIDGKAKATKGSYIVLAEWKCDKHDWVFVGAKMVKVDGERIKENTFYTLKNGKFVEVSE